MYVATICENFIQVPPNLVMNKICFVAAITTFDFTTIYLIHITLL